LRWRGAAQSAFGQSRACGPRSFRPRAGLARVIDDQGRAGIYDVRALALPAMARPSTARPINKAIEIRGGGRWWDECASRRGRICPIPFGSRATSRCNLDSGARLLAANRSIHGGDGYDAAEDIGDAARYEDFGHGHWHNSLIMGENIENITINRPGLIDGGLYDDTLASTTLNPKPHARAAARASRHCDGLGARGRGTGAAARAPATGRARAGRGNATG